MHKKFIEKLNRDILLDEMEQSAKDIEGVFKTICLLEDYCHKCNNVLEVANMTYIIEKIKSELFCLHKELDGIVKRQKYNQEDYLDKLKNLNADNVILDD